jgi:hypothetical protein
VHPRRFETAEAGCERFIAQEMLSINGQCTALEGKSRVCRMLSVKAASDDEKCRAFERGI